MSQKAVDILSDISLIMKNAVIIVPRVYDFLATIDFESNYDVFHLQKLDDVKYMIDKAEELCAKYRNIYIVRETHPLFACITGKFCSSEEWYKTTFECNVFYLHFDKELKEYLPYKINE